MITAELRVALEALVMRFAWLIDHRHGDGVAELFTPDGVYTFGSTGSLEGRAAIEGFYQLRRAGGPRTSRHLFSNLHLRAAEADRVEGTCVLTLHAAHGDPPLPLKPVMVADYDDVYIREPDGAWRFKRREVTLVFGDVPQLSGATD